MEDLNTNITESEVTTEVTVENQEPSKVEVETYSAEDYKKGMQSAASKAKFEILKELGIASVKEFRDLKTTYENSISNMKTIEENLNNVNKKNNELQEELILSKLGVSDEYKNDLLTLAKSKVSEEHGLEEVSKELLNKYPQWLRSNEKVKIGTEKSEIEKKTSKYSNYENQKWPWLK